MHCFVIYYWYHLQEEAPAVSCLVIWAEPPLTSASRTSPEDRHSASSEAVVPGFHWRPTTTTRKEEDDNEHVLVPECTGIKKHQIICQHSLELAVVRGSSIEHT